MSFWGDVKKRKAAAEDAQDSASFNRFKTEATKALPELYQPAYSSISRQMNPQYRKARAYLATNPAAGNSGVGARLDRVLGQEAYGALGESLGQTTAGVAGRGLDLFDSLLRRRQEERYKMAEENRNKGGIGSAVGGIVGYGAKRAVDKVLPF